MYLINSHRLYVLTNIEEAKEANDFLTFSQHQKNVDYKVMLSFLEFYEVLLSFVNFKLFHTIGMGYPPQLDQFAVSRGELLSAIQDPTAAVTTTTSTNAPTEAKKPEESAELKKQKEASTFPSLKIPCEFPFLLTLLR